MHSAPPTDPLRAFLSGKRKDRRHPVSCAVTLSGPDGLFSARAVNLSLGGALVAMPESMIEEQGHFARGEYLEVIERNFCEGFDLRFPDHGIVVEAQIVRLSVQPGREGLLYLGCRFRETLSERQASALGVDGRAAAADPGGALGEPKPWDTLPIDLLPYEPREPIQFCIYDDRIPGPRYVARLLRCGDRALAFEIDGAAVAEVTARLGRQPCRLRLVDAGRTAWESSATLLGVRHVDRPGGRVHLAVLADIAPPRLVRRRLRRA